MAWKLLCIGIGKSTPISWEVVIFRTKSTFFIDNDDLTLINAYKKYNVTLIVHTSYPTKTHILVFKYILYHTVIRR